MSTYDNDERYAIAETPVDYDIGWTRFDWETAGEVVYVCPTVTDAADEAEAIATAAADASEGFDSGCPSPGGWYPLTPI